MVDEDFRRQIAGEKAGAAIKFTDIDGIGPATAKKIKSVILDKGGKVQAPRDVADMSAEELSEKAGISKSRAEKAIKGGGGNPQFSDTGSTGTTEAGNIANALDSATEQSAQIVNEREDFFSQLVETGEQIPDQRERRNNPESIPFYDRDTEEVRELGQAADIFSKATAEPISPTAEKPDTGFDDEAREKAAEVKLAAGRVLEEREGLDFQEATSETRGSPENTPNFGVVESVLGFGATSTVGQFEVSEPGQEQAREAYADQSREAKQVDSRRRAPVTTDADTYSRNPGELDFPGVDTPSKDPKVLPKDLKQKQQPRTTEPDEQYNEDNGRPDTIGFAIQEGPSTGREKSRSLMGELQERDVSLSPDEAFRGVGTGGIAEMGNNPNIPVEDRFARYDADAETEQEELDEIAAQEQRLSLFKQAPAKLPGGFERTRDETFGSGGGRVRFERDTDLPDAKSEVIEVQENSGRFSIYSGFRGFAFDEQDDISPVFSVEQPDDASAIFGAAKEAAEPGEDEEEETTDPFVGNPGQLASEKERDDMFRGPN